MNDKLNKESIKSLTSYIDYYTNNFVGLVLFFIGGVCLFIFIHKIYHVFLKKHKAVYGKILKSEVEESVHVGTGSTGSSVGMMYRAVVEYEYEVDNEKFLGSTIFAGGDSSSSIKTQFETLVNQYKTGSTVKVYFDPLNPKKAFLQKTIHLFDFFILILSFVFLGGGCFKFFY